MSHRSVLGRRRDRLSGTPSRASRPKLEGLEERFLLYAASGGSWTYPIRITYSFVPDGTAILGGGTSNLFATMNQYYSTATWEATIEKAAAIWENAANINLSLVPDNGAPLGGPGYQEGDPNFGDIRIDASPLGSGLLAATSLPPPLSTGTDAGDITFSSSVNWGTTGNTPIDLLSVAVHEFGHALGLDHTTVSGAVMYPYYTGPDQTLASDDIAGIQSIYGPPPADTSGTGSLSTALDLTSSISNNQITLPSLYNSSYSDQHWFKVVVPSTTTGTMTVTMQTANLSSLAPRVTIFSYNSTYKDWVGTAQGLSTSLAGATVSATINNVTPGQTYYFRASSAVSGAGSVGAYGLLVNFGNGSLAPIAPPNTQVPTPGGNQTVTYLMDTYSAAPDQHHHHPHHPNGASHHQAVDHVLASWERHHSR